MYLKSFHLQFLYQTSKYNIVGAIALKLSRIYKTLKYHITSQEYSLLTFCSFHRLQSINADYKLKRLLKEPVSRAQW